MFKRKRKKDTEINKLVDQSRKDNNELQKILLKLQESC